MNLRRARNIIIVVVVLLMAVAVVVSLVSGGEDMPTKTLSDVIADAREGLVAEIEVDGDLLTVRMKTGQEFEARKEADSSIVMVLASNDVKVGGPDGVVVEVDAPSRLGNWLGILISFLPILIIGGFLWLAVTKWRR